MEATPGMLTRQAIDNPHFKLPDRLSEIPLPALWDWHMDNSPNHTLFVHEGSGGDIKHITVAEAVQAAHRAGSFALSSIKKDLASGASPVVGILAHADSLTSWALLLGLMHTGYIPLLVSPRNSAVAVAHLLSSAKCTTLIVSGDQGIQDLVSATLPHLGNDSETLLALINIPQFKDFYDESGTFERLPAFPASDIKTPSLIAHSSGSTSFPKLIALTHKYFMDRQMCKYSDFDLCGKRLGVHAFPMFHAAGFLLQIAWPATSGLTLGIYPPRNPPVIPTSERMLYHATATSCDFLFCVPSFVEEWARDDEKIEQLKVFSAIFVGSGPTRNDIGDKLVRSGVNIRNAYGATEIGFGTVLSNKLAGEDWNYIRPPPAMKVHWGPQDGNPDKCELIVLADENLAPAVCNTEIDGVPAYASGDVMERHPTDSRLWRIFGRTDDQIMHSTGEKTNPGPLELIIKTHPAVYACVMFGRGKFQAGVLVQPTLDREFNPNDSEKLAAFRNEIWPAVEKTNEYAPKHSRIFKEMIIVTEPCRPFEYTPKGTIRRKVVLNEYTQEIENVYVAVEEASNNGSTPPPSWTEEGTLGFIRTVVRAVLESQIGDDDDIFQHGADSLRATVIRSSVMSALRKTEKPVNSLEQNLVYSHPSISSLAKFIFMLANDIGDAAVAPEAKIEEMKALVTEFTQDFPTHRPSLSLPDIEGVLVTGTTGSLGSHILNYLLLDDRVGWIFALNRPDKSGKHTLAERQKQAFREHGLEESALTAAKLVLLEGDTAAPMFGLNPQVYKDALNTTTSIIHNAWRVDFNIPLSSFKPLVRGVRNLVDFSLSSPFPWPPTILFTSSIGTVLGWKEDTAVPELPVDDPSVALGSGYTQSKWVSQRVLEIARDRTRMHATILRVGQICGNTVNGNWNQWEWFPAVIQSHKIAKCLPDEKGVVSWLPADVAGAAVADLRNSRLPLLHLVHPKPVPWTDVLTPIAQMLDVPLVPYKVWLARVEDALQSMPPDAASGIAVFKLIEFYRHVHTDDAASQVRDAFTGINLETKEVKRASKILANPRLPSLSELDAFRWLSYWRSIGVL